MGSAVEAVENASFVDRIRWSKKSYSLRMLLEFRHPPCIVSVPEGYRGSNDVENLPPGLVVRINSVFAERRIFARCADGRVFSIPETFPIKFEVIKKNRKRSKAKRLDEILRNYRPPIVVALDRRNNRWTFRNGKTVQSEDSLGTMVLLKAYFEHFARVNQLIDGAIDRRVFLIPLYLDLDVRLAEGLKNENTSELSNLMNMYSKAVQSIDYSAYTGLNAILEFDPSAGSVHPLAASRHPSMENSIPGVSDSKTVTDVGTQGVRGSQASGSQGRARRGRSEDPRQRRRVNSEDFEGTMTLEGRGGNRLAVKSSETKFINVSTDYSSSSGESSAAEELELLKESGRGGPAAPPQMSRRKGRSAEELQARPTRGRAASPEVASLDRLPEVSQAKINRRRPAEGVQNDPRHETENQQTSRRGTTGQQEEGRGARDDSTIVSSHRSRSRNPVVAAQPTPKPRKEMSRRQSDNSAASGPPGTTGTKDRKGQSMDRPVALNRSQDWTSSPAPNYHIHINIQSPNSAQATPHHPTTMSSVAGHSTVIHRTPPTTLQPAHPFLDTGHVSLLNERPLKQTFARQQSHPDGPLYPVRNSHPRHEPRKPNVIEATRQVHHARQEPYPPRIAESVRHAYIGHAAPPPKLSEPGRPTYIRQETYPRENARWNNSSSRGFFRDLVPTMSMVRPSERRSTSGRLFVSSVSCTGSDSLDLPGKNNFMNEGHQRSHGLRSKVIRLKNGDDSEIAEMEVKEFYGRTSTIRSTGNYVNLANGEVNNNLSSGEYHYPFGKSSLGSTKMAATQIIELPVTQDTSLVSHHKPKFKLQDQSTRGDGGQTRDAQRSRNWVLRSGIQKPDSRSVAPIRQSLGTTIAV